MAFLRSLSGVLLPLLVLGCQETGKPPDGVSEAPDIFQERTADAGINFAHRSGASGGLRLREIMGPGVGLLDFDADGDLDLYLVQGAEEEGQPAGDRLYRNDTTGTEAWQFVDVTERARIHSLGEGMGVSVGDIDGDGCLDIYVLNLGANQVWRNRCDGTFEDHTAVSGLADGAWSVSASFFDSDSDGDLDLYVVNYLEVSLKDDGKCSTPMGVADYCGPLAYSPAQDSLFRNEGDGRFVDVSEVSGIQTQAHNGLGSVALDANQDGRVDLYVANDMMPNFLWMNQGDGTFADQGLLAGVAVNRSGQSEASMGIALGDIDQDRDLDLLVSHLRRESHTLYLNLGISAAAFEDDTARTGLVQATNAATGFGAQFLDYDLDGWPDLAVVNGGVSLYRGRSDGGPPTLEEPNQLFRNLGNGQFVDVSEQAGPGFLVHEISRGLAAGDLDNDGRADLLLGNNAGPTRLLANRLQTENQWLGLSLVNETPGRDPLMTRATVEVRGSGPRSAVAGNDGSYASSRDPRVVFGLEELTAVESIDLESPIDGRRVRFLSPPMNRYVRWAGSRLPSVTP